MCRKLLSIILAVIMVVGLLPITAMAIAINPPFHVDGDPASSLADAFSKAKNSGSVITQDGNTSDMQRISNSIEVKKDVTLALGKEEYNGNVNKKIYHRRYVL